ncbi:MAG: GNAT family N-acetyltransferase [Ferrovibrio sp.]
MLAAPIRPATDHDARAISALIRRTLRVSNAADYSVDEINRVYAYFSVDGVAARIQRQDVFVAEIDGDIVATVGYEKGELWALFVAPECQRLGLGSILVEHIERHARKRGDRKLGLSASLTGVEFYERLGYRRLAHRRHASGVTYDMVKGL